MMISMNSDKAGFQLATLPSPRIIRNVPDSTFARFQTRFYFSKFPQGYLYIRINDLFFSIIASFFIFLIIRWNPIFFKKLKNNKSK